MVFNFQQKTPGEILYALDRYAVGKTNVTYECFVFHMRKQVESESTEYFITAFVGIDKNFWLLWQLHDQIILEIQKHQTQAELLKVKKLEL